MYNKLFDRIAKVNDLNMLDSNGVERIVRARYLQEYLVGNNDWGEFQTHRRLYGLITIGKLPIIDYMVYTVNRIVILVNTKTGIISYYSFIIQDTQTVLGQLNIFYTVSVNTNK